MQRGRLSQAEVLIRKLMKDHLIGVLILFHQGLPCGCQVINFRLHNLKVVTLTCVGGGTVSHRNLLNECYIAHKIIYSWRSGLICSEHFYLQILQLPSVFHISCLFMSTAKVFHTCYPHIVQTDQSRVHLMRGKSFIY